MSRQGRQMPGMAARVSRDDAGGAGATPQEADAGVLLPAGAEGDGFDAWLRGELSGLYGAVLAEPVPEDMVRLLREAAARR